MASNTYHAVGNKEDVSDIITNIAPYDTPLYTRIGKAKATQVMHEWIEDELGQPMVNKFVEGYTYSTVDATPRNRLFNYTQIMHRGVHVTDTQEAVLHYGIRSEMAYQMIKVRKEPPVAEGSICGTIPSIKNRNGGKYNMLQEVVPFFYITQNNTTATVRTHSDEDGNAWFVAKDVCDVLGLTDTSKTCERLDDDEKLVRKLFVSGQKRDVLLVNESGLYALIFTSNKPEAKRFRKWITSEVLPQIRKTGSYSMMNLDRCPAGMMKKDHRIYSVKTSIATIEAPATATGRKFILEMLDELNIR